MDLETRLDNHIKEDAQKFLNLLASIDNLRENHLAHLKDDLTEVKADLKWVKWLVMGAVAATITNLVTRLIAL